MFNVNPMSTRRFLDVFCEEQQEKQRFCFILGSGASYASGIRTGVVLMEQWRADLEKLEEEKGSGYIQECAEAAGYDWDVCKNMFGKGHRSLQNEDYFTLYDIRFAGSPTAGYAFLEQEMANTSPNVGYYYLASILYNTNNRLVITTNFDSLTEDALFYYSGHHPLVLGDERLASYVANVDRKPVIAKIHRDLLMNPMNHQDEMQALQKEWQTPLTTVLSQYIPIVIGYAGGDQTLMSLLEELKLKGIFWCTLGDEPPAQAKRIISKNRGYWVKIQGFDELLFQMVERLNKIPSVNKMRRDAYKRYKDYEERDRRLREKYNISQMKKLKREEEQPDVDMIQAVAREERRNAPGTKEYRDLLTQALKLANTDGEKAVDLCAQAIELKPDDAVGYEFMSTIHHVLGEYEKALADVTEAIRLSPNDSRYYQSRAVTLHAMERYEDALKDRDKALELDPHKARYYYQRAITLHAMERYEDALKDRNKALELEPENAEYYSGRAITLHAMERYDDALPDRNRAIELNPNDAKFYDGRSTTLHEMKRYAQALEDADKAVSLDPQNAHLYYQRAITLRRMQRYQDAVKDIEEALVLDPQNEKYSSSLKDVQAQLRQDSDQQAEPEPKGAPK